LSGIYNRAIHWFFELVIQKILLAEPKSILDTDPLSNQKIDELWMVPLAGISPS